MNEQTFSFLVEKAISAREASYSPYSNFAVGAALLCADGTVFTGANIENASYSPTICAERVAFFSAVHNNHREFSAIAIVGGNAGEAISKFCPPCGVCRQVMSEFCGKDFTIFLEGENSDIIEITLGELLPFAFDI